MSYTETRILGIIFRKELILWLLNVVNIIMTNLGCPRPTYFWQAAKYAINRRKQLGRFCGRRQWWQQVLKTEFIYVIPQFGGFYPLNFL